MKNANSVKVLTSHTSGTKGSPDIVIFLISEQYTKNLTNRFKCQLYLMTTEFFWLSKDI